MNFMDLQDEIYLTGCKIDLISFFNNFYKHFFDFILTRSNDGDKFLLGFVRNIKGSFSCCDNAAAFHFLFNDRSSINARFIYKLQ